LEGRFTVDRGEEDEAMGVEPRGDGTCRLLSAMTEAGAELQRWRGEESVGEDGKVGTIGGEFTGGEGNMFMRILAGEYERTDGACMGAENGGGRRDDIRSPTVGHRRVALGTGTATG